VAIRFYFLSVTLINRFTNHFPIQKRGNVPTQSWSGKSAVLPYGERSDVPRFQQVEQKAVGRQRNLALYNYIPYIRDNPDSCTNRNRLCLNNQIVKIVSINNPSNIKIVTLSVLCSASTCLSSVFSTSAGPMAEGVLHYDK
jgi:hypothetical protein